VWTGAFYTGNEFKQVQLIQVMSGEQESLTDLPNLSKKESLM
jgi:hypothetical protein